MYDGKSQLLIKNPLDRYLINWLPAPNDPHDSGTRP
jgi:hypothetical protein